MRRGRLSIIRSLAKGFLGVLGASWRARVPVGSLVLGAGLAAAACSGGTSVFSLEVGDCFNDPNTTALQVAEVDAVPCAEPHDNEVYAVADHPAGDDDPYPGVRALDTYGWDYCLGEFAGYVGISYEDSRLEVSYLQPSTDSWEDDDDREIVCFLYDFDLRRLRGSMQGSRE